jgi:hypothetical protein
MTVRGPVDIDLSDANFEEGQVYVALSRAQDGSQVRVVAQVSDEHLSRCSETARDFYTGQSVGVGTGAASAAGAAAQAGDAPGGTDVLHLCHPLLAPPERWRQLCGPVAVLPAASSTRGSAHQLSRTTHTLVGLTIEDVACMKTRVSGVRTPLSASAFFACVL